MKKVDGLGEGRAFRRPRNSTPNLGLRPDLRAFGFSSDEPKIGMRNLPSQGRFECAAIWGEYATLELPSGTAFQVGAIRPFVPIRAWRWAGLCLAGMLNADSIIGF